MENDEARDGRAVGRKRPENETLPGAGKAARGAVIRNLRDAERSSEETPTEDSPTVDANRRDCGSAGAGIKRDVTDSSFGV
jgi:hypothetical protein